MVQSILVTGGSGNLGRYVVAELKDRYAVTIFDQVSPGEYSHWASRLALPWETDVPFVKGDLTSLGDLMRAIAFAKADAVVHLAAFTAPTDLVPGTRRVRQTHPEDACFRVNTMGTFVVMDAARRLGVEKVVFASSFFVLGIGNRISKRPFRIEYLPIDEQHPNRPEDSYSLSKVLGEEILATFSRAYGIQTVALRLLGIEHPHRPTHRFGISPEAPSGLATTYSCFQYVDSRDVAQAIRLSLEATDLEPFEAFYLSTDTTLVEDTRDVVERLYPDLREMAASLQGKEGLISIAKARQKLGYDPKWSWRDRPPTA